MMPQLSLTTMISAIRFLILASLLHLVAASGARASIVAAVHPRHTNPTVHLRGSNGGGSSTTLASKTSAKADAGGEERGNSRSCDEGCEYEGAFYCRDEIIPMGDGCNTCRCVGPDPGAVGCTKMYCPDPMDEPIPIGGSNQLGLEEEEEEDRQGPIVGAGLSDLDSQ